MQKACFYRMSAKAMICSGEYILLVKEDSDTWDLPGGGVEHFEQLQEALLRELNEEIGLEDDDVESISAQPITILKYHSKRSGNHGMHLVYAVVLSDEYAVPESMQDTVKMHAIESLKPEMLDDNVRQNFDEIIATAHAMSQVVSD